MNLVLNPSGAIPVIRTPEQTYILKKEDNEESIRQLHEETRNALEFWYTRKSPDQALDEIKNKDALYKAHREEAYQSISLDNKSDDHVIPVLKHRDEIMRKKAIIIVEDRLRNTNAEPSRVADLSDKLRAEPRLLVAMFNTEDKEALTKAMAIICVILDDGLSEKLRQTGGIPSILKLAANRWGETEEEFSQFLMYTVVFLSRHAENKEIFRSCGGLIDLVRYLESPFPKVKALATQAMINLSLPEKNQPVITRGGAIPILFTTAKSSNDDLQLKVETLYVLRNLAYCEEGRAAISPSDLRYLVDSMNHAEAFPTPQTEGTPEYREKFLVQKVLLHAILEFSNSDKNRYYFSQSGIIKRLLQFFAPLSEKNGLLWNYEILERVLAILDRLIALEEIRNEFLDSRGLLIVSHVVKDSNKYPEECILNAAQIITTLATHATMTQQKHAEQGVSTLLALLQQYPDREVIQNFVAKLLKSVAENGLNKSIILSRGGTQILIRLVKESRVKPILVNSAAGLAALSSDDSVVQEILSEDLVPELVGLLQLNVPELQVSIATILLHLAATDEGTDAIIKKGGVHPLITLLHSKDISVQEAGLLTLAKVLFAKGMAEGIQRYFFNAEGEKQLLKLMDSNSDNVRVPAVSIVHALSQTRNGRHAIREAGIQVKIEVYERAGKLDGDDQMANILRLIKINLKKEAAENLQRQQEEADRQKKEQAEEEAEKRRYEETLAAVKAVKEVEERKKNQKFWLKVECEGACKLFAVTQQLSFEQFVGIVSDHFGLDSWSNMTWRDGPNDVTLEDQSDLFYVLDKLQEGHNLTVTIHLEQPIQSSNSDAKATQIETLLMELTPRQLRELVKSAISEGANIIPAMKEYINLNRGIRKNMSEEKITNLVAKHRAANPGIPSAVTTTTTTTTINSSSISAPPPPPPMLSEPSKDLDKRKINEKPNNMEYEASARGSSNSSLFQDLQQGRGNLKKIDLSSSAAAFSASASAAFLEDIKKGAKLSHVNVDEHLKKREEEKKQGNREGLMEEIRKQGGDIHFKLLNQGINYGRKYWVNQPERFIEELQKGFLLDYNFINILFELVQSDQSVLFKDLHSKLKEHEKITQGDFANALSNIGFSLRSQKFVIEGKEDEEPMIEYTHIFQPDDLPVPIVLKTILATIKGLPPDYSYEVVEEDLQFLPLPTPHAGPQGSSLSSANLDELVQQIPKLDPPKEEEEVVSLTLPTKKSQ